MHSSRLKMLPLATILSLLILSGLGGCISDSLTTSSADVLSFSTDVVEFDTVFTGQGTPTARLKVFNRAKKGVNISSIRFKNPDGGFAMNVDGVSGESFRDVEIRGGDSIFVFVECFIDPTEANEPFLREDEIVFVTNGVTQTIRCEAYGQNVNRMKGVTLSEDLTMTADRPYVVFDSLVVPEGKILAIEPGARVLFHDKASLIVRGTLDARGEAEKLIQMRGDRLDNVLPDVGYDIMAGQWEGIVIAPESYDNRLEYVDMRSTVSGLKCEEGPDPERTKLTIVNSWLHNSQGHVLETAHNRVEAYGVCFSEAALSVVSLAGGVNTFSQCTVANNYLFSAISGPLIELGHLRPSEENPVPDKALLELSFDNGVVCSPYTGPLNEDDLTGTGATFRYTVFGVGGRDDDNFLNCLWETDPDFCTVRSDYYFNYHVRPDSPIIGKGDPALIPVLSETDMDGAERLIDGAVTPGAYALPEDPEAE